MNQNQLENKVRELFERQGFEVEKGCDKLIARNGQTLVLKVFSSEKYSLEEVLSSVKQTDKVFVDEELEDVKEELRNDVSVLKEEDEDPDFDTPSYEVIGDIAVINDLAEVDREEAVEGILHYHPSLKTVLLKDEGLSGEFRVGEYEKLYGEETETVHKEHGCRYKVDPTKVYFSERFGTERERVVSQIEDGEKVLVMFAGVGPFAIMAARNANLGKVVAVEKNPIGADYLKENIELNNVEDIVEGVEGDVAGIVPELDEKFDRIIMPLPGSAEEFLDIAFESTAKDGIIHYYRFLEDEDWASLETEIENMTEKTGVDYEILNRVKCGEKSPSTDRVCIEIRKK